MMIVTDKELTTLYESSVKLRSVLFPNISPAFVTYFKAGFKMLHC